MNNKKNLINVLRKDEVNRFFQESLKSIRGGANEGAGTVIGKINPGCTFCRKICTMCLAGGSKTGRPSLPK